MGTANQFDLLDRGSYELAIYALAPNGVVTTWNARAERILGYRGEEVIGRHFSLFYPHEKVAAAYPEWELTQAASAGIYIDQGWRLRKDGSRFWAHVSIVAQRSNHGDLHGYIKVVRDESETRRRHQRSTRRFTDLLDVAPVGIGLFDEFDYILHANESLCDLLGYRLDELIGRSGTSLLTGDDLPNHIVPALQEPGSATGTQTRRQRTLARSDGRHVVCELYSAASTEDDGTPFWQVVFQDVTEQRRHTEMLHYQATHDELTGLPNRAGINERFAELLGDCEPGHAAVLLCDLDNFKRVNDSLGHDGGDELLVALARRLVTGVPHTCVAGRLAGDEFVVLCSDLEAVGGLNALTAQVAELLRTVVEIRDQAIWMSASIGAAVVERKDLSGEDMLRLTDAAMFRAKRHRPGSVSVAGPELTTWMSGQLKWEGRLRDALRDNRLQLHYQPLINLRGEIIMAEALLRWPHPESGLIAPARILAIAERGNLLWDIDRWVLTTALREASGWPAVRGRPVRISVNLSRLLPDDPHFVQEVSEIVERSGISASRVVLEVLETSLVDLPMRPRDAMAELGARGIAFAVDDFGTGYSSMKRLKDLPAELIKIDREFVADMENDSADFSIVRAAAEMSRGMRRRCVAEGVETATQLHLLADLGVGIFQGFLFSPPVPAEEFRELLAGSTIAMPYTNA